MPVCGHQQRIRLAGVPVPQLTRTAASVLPDVLSQKITFYSAYVGRVPLEIAVIKDSRYAMQSRVVAGERMFEVKVLDCQQFQLQPDVHSYNVAQLKDLASVQLDQCDNEYDYYAKLMLSVEIARLQQSTTVVSCTQQVSDFLTGLKSPEDITKLKLRYSTEFSKTAGSSLVAYQQQLHSVLLRLVPVDILFGTVQYLNFIYTQTGLVGLQTEEPYLLSLYNIPKLDNAFYSGDGIMVFGNGDNQFYPLGSMDVIGHELGHGVVDALGGLEYQGHSGALNESLADILGTMFEFYVVEKFKLHTVADFLIGEDIDRQNKYLRNMMNPLDCQQPNCLKGQYYVEPTNSFDYGGVHVNSGIINYGFYLLCQELGRDETFKTIFQCFKDACLISKTCTFQAFGHVVQKTFFGKADSVLKTIKLHPENFNNNRAQKPLPSQQPKPQPNQQPKLPQQPQWPQSPQLPQWPQWPQHSPWPQWFQQPQWCEGTQHPQWSEWSQQPQQSQKGPQQSQEGPQQPQEGPQQPQQAQWSQWPQQLQQAHWSEWPQQPLQILPTRHLYPQQWSFQPRYPLFQPHHQF